MTKVENSVTLAQVVKLADAGLSPGQLTFLIFGYCPFCQQAIRGFKPVMGIITKKRMEDAGIDPENGHKKTCKHKEIVLP